MITKSLIVTFHKYQKNNVIFKVYFYYIYSFEKYKNIYYSLFLYMKSRT